MGTRHLQTVITKQGETKIRQYGQWDGYPEGQGVEILKYLKKGNLAKYQENLEKIPIITDAQIKEVDDDKNWSKNYPYLSRDCGSDIHQMIEEGHVKFVQFIELEEADKWCEGFYTIDFQKNLFISEYHGQIESFKLSKLPSIKTYLKKFKSSE